jgi:hypothetical protein
MLGRENKDRVRDRVIDDRGGRTFNLKSNEHIFNG